MGELLTDTIVIEGLGGVGKTTTAKGLAEHYGFSNFNTGTLFRASSAGALLQNINVPDMADYMQAVNFTIDISDAAKPMVAVDGRDVSELLQNPEVTKLASHAGTLTGAAERLEGIFNQALKGSKMVVEGKNLADRVAVPPGFRFFLVASSEMRAYRKWLQAQQNGKHNYTITEARLDIYLNDTRDGRLLTLQEGTKIIDTTYLTPFQVVQAIAKHAHLIK